MSWIFEFIYTNHPYCFNVTILTAAREYLDERRSFAALLWPLKKHPPKMVKTLKKNKKTADPKEKYEVMEIEVINIWGSDW